jgi:hypothetical protein
MAVVRVHVYIGSEKNCGVQTDHKHGLISTSKPLFFNISIASRHL